MADRTPEQQALADAFLAHGFRLPMRPGGMLGRGLAEADGTPRFAGLTGEGLSTQRGLALLVSYAVNAITGTPDHETGPLPVLTPLAADTIRAASNPLDPNHLVALAQAARRPAAE